jgi:hypothetical protein
MKGTKISSHVCGSPCHVNMVFSKADHSKGLNMLIQGLGQGCDCFLPACCVVYNARLLSLLDNPAHSQGSPCLPRRHDTATQGPNETPAPGTQASPENEDISIQVRPHDRCLQMTMRNAYACAWVAPLIRTWDSS